MRNYLAEHKECLHPYAVNRHAFSRHTVADGKFYNFVRICHHQTLIKRNLPGCLGNVEKLGFDRSGADRRHADSARAEFFPQGAAVA